MRKSCVVTLMISAAVLAAKEPSSVRHVIVYKETGRYAGWPANHGAWQWGNELLVGFEIGYLKATDKYHAIDYDRPEEHVLARSKDGGETWTIEKPEGLRPPPGARVAGVPVAGGKPVTDFTGRMDFKKPGFAMTLRMESFHFGPSRFYYTEDKGKSWNGPFRVPDFDTPGTAARTDYLIDGPHEATVFLTAAKSDKREGRLLCARTTDGGRTFKFISWIVPEGEGFAIMPSSVRLSPTTILTSIRRRSPAKGNWIELQRSDDNGATWKLVSIVTPEASAKSSNPPSMIKLKDGRLCITYGDRLPPYGIKARLSRDAGKTWGEEIALRTGAGNHDLGYPRTFQRPDGKIVTAYYYNDKADGERYIAATIWEP